MSTDPDTTTVIVGSGLAGVRCASTLRRLDAGRRVVLVGDEPHDAYERPPLSKEFLVGAREADQLTLAGSDRTALEALGVEVRAPERVARLLDGGGVELASGDRIEAAHVVLATGARARTIATDADPDRVHVLRSLADARRLREALAPGTRLAIIGSGFVGAEVAGSAASMGIDVTLVEAAPVPFARTLGADAGLWLADRWRDAGIDVRLGIGVDAIADMPGGVRLTLASGDAIDAEHVLVAIGTIPNDELFHDAHPGHARPGAGVPVDPDGRTPVAGLHAIGDVALVTDPALATARRLEHWTDAATGALRLARLLAGAAPGPRPAPYAWSDQFGLRVQVTGDVDPAHLAQVDNVDEQRLLVRYVDEAGTVRGVTAVGHPDTVARYRARLAA